MTRDQCQKGLWIMTKLTDLHVWHWLSDVIRKNNKKHNKNVKKNKHVRVYLSVIPVADSPAQCSSVQPDCRPRFSPVSVSPAKPHVHFFFSTEIKQRYIYKLCNHLWKPIQVFIGNAVFINTSDGWESFSEIRYQWLWNGYINYQCFGKKIRFSFEQLVPNINNNNNNNWVQRRNVNLVQADNQVMCSSFLKNAKKERN